MSAMPPLSKSWSITNAVCFESSGPYMAEVEERFERDVIDTSCSAMEWDRIPHCAPDTTN